MDAELIDNALPSKARHCAERILAYYRFCAIEAYKDPEFVAEMREWDEMDDGIDFADYEWLENVVD